MGSREVREPAYRHLLLPTPPRPLHNIYAHYSHSATMRCPFSCLPYPSSLCLRTCTGPPSHLTTEAEREGEREGEMGLCGYPHGFLPILVIQTLLFLALLKEKLRRAFPLVGRAPGSASTPEFCLPAAFVPDAGRSPITVRRFNSVCDGGGGRPTACCVCLEGFEGEEEVGELPSCGHCFHWDCLERWVGDHMHRTCPLCRALL